MENTLNYFAGIVDGEGSIGISKQNKKLKDNARGYAYRPFFHITNTCLPLLQYLQKHFGGNISYLDERASCYNYTFPANKIRELLPQLIPYLLVRKEQAEIVLKFLDKVEKTNFCRLTNEDYVLYEQYFLECRRLKGIRYDYKPTRVPFGTKTCIVCGKEFLAYSFNHKYCTHYCKQESHWKRSNETQRLKRLEKK